jgi:hypothetical protein
MNSNFWDWNDAFSKSSLGDNIYYVKYAFRDSIAKVLKEWEIEFYDNGSWSQINASTEESYYAFLDGGYASIDGNYFIGRRGCWIVGTKALRFMCHELQINPPKRKLKTETFIPTSAALSEELKDQVNNRFGEMLINQLVILDLFSRTGN